jgi:EAL domain-containing protein (putative c-di-GMP-specific phosphodiesterase class I)
VERIIGETGLDPHYIILEITETALMQDVEFTRSVLKQFKDLGFGIAIDDFGTGYSSLNYLKRFPIDYLKIDISFIKDITTDPDAAAIVTAIISMAHSLGLKTIAEGVETKEQREILRLLRCDIIQGFYYSRPVPAADIEPILAHGGVFKDKELKEHTTAPRQP